MSALLALMMSLVLTACSAVPVINVRAAPPSEAVEASEEVELTYEVSLESYADSAQAEDGTPLVSYSFLLPVMRVLRSGGEAVEAAENPAEERALASAETFNRRFGEWAAAKEFDGLVEEARAALDWQKSEGLPWTQGYTLELTCGVYQAGALISVLGTYYSYTGGAHPNTWQLSWNFDLTEGVFFEPEFLSEGTDLGEAVSNEIIRQANEPGADGRVPAEGYWEDYAAIIANWGSYAVFFDESGMGVIFSPYELAAYAAGPQEFRVSYDWLYPHLSEHGQKLLGLAPS